MNRIALRLVLPCLFLLGAATAWTEDRLAWKETRTEHCVFIYQEKDASAARELVGFAEEVYGQVSRYLNSYPKEVRSIVLGNLDLANGSYSAPPHHLELRVRAPIDTFLGARGEGWLKLLFTHELTHFCDMDADEGFFYVLSLILGEGVKSGNSGLRPAWTYEGLAVLLETEFSNGGRGRNPFFLMYAKALLDDDVSFTLGHLEFASAFPPPNRYYLFGYMILDYLKRQYGPDAFRQIRKRFLDFPLFGPWGAIRDVTGKHQDALWSAVRADWKTRLDALAPTLAGAGEGQAASPIVFGDYNCPFVTDGGYYLYRKRLDLPPAVVSYDPVKQSEKVLFEEYLTDEHSLAVSRDGRKIVYATTISSGGGLTRGRLTSDLYLAEISGAETGRPSCAARKKITNNKHLWQPALSADGARLAAVQGAGAYARLVLVDQATGRVSVLYAEEGVAVYTPAFSPDGTRIAFSLNRRGQQDIFVIDADAATVSAESDADPLLNVNLDKARPLLGTDASADYFPRWLDERTILFTSDREGWPALYEASIDKRELFRVCADRIAAFDGAVDADGLLYTTYRGRGYAVRKILKAELEHVAVALTPDTEPAPPLVLPDIVSQPFVDWPGFQFWLPNANYLMAQGQFQFAFGVYVLFASYLGTNGIDLSLLYYPTFNQPELHFNFNTELGPLNLYYSLNHTFAERGSGASLYYREDIGQSLTFELPLVDWSAASGGDYVSVSLGLGHDFLMDGLSPFAFLNSFSPSTIAHGNFLSTDAGFFFSHSQYGGPAAFYAPWTVVNSFDLFVPLPVLDEHRQGFVVTDSFYCTLPGLWNLSAFRLGLKADYQTDQLRGGTWVNPRGMASQPQAEPGRAIFLLDYLFTIVYTDAPLFGGLHFDGLGAGLHWEVPVDFDVVSPSFAFDRYFYLGAEITIKAGLGVVSLPIGLGVTVRLDWGLSAAPGLTDFGFYYFLSFNSFWSGLNEKPPLDRRFR